MQQAIRIILMLYAFATLYLTLMDGMIAGEMSARDWTFFVIDILIWIFTS